MPISQTRWNIVVSKETDRGLRQFLANQGRGKKGDISQFVEEAVSKYIFESTVNDVKQRNASIPAEEIDAIVEDALAWARRS